MSGSWMGPNTLPAEVGDAAVAVLLEVLAKVVPIFVCLILGAVAARRGTIKPEGIVAIKSLVANFTLPFVIFGAFYSLRLGASTAAVSLLVLVVCLVTFAGGFWARRVSSGRHRSLYPYLFSGYEMGMLGFPLYALLVGGEHASNLAVLDIGHELFVFGVFVSFLLAESGDRLSPRSTITRALRNPVMIALLAGLVSSVTGLSSALDETFAGALVRDTAGFIAGPTAVLILFAIGYESASGKGDLGPAIRVVLARLAVMAPLAALVSVAVFALVPFDSRMLLAILLMFSLPAPFVIPVFSKNAEHNHFAATVLSIHTLVTLLVFVVLVVLNSTVLSSPPG